MTNKEDFIKSFLPETANKAKMIEINLDICGLGIADILRNINNVYPKTSIEREMITSGELIIGILCKSEYLYPIKGLILLITNDKATVSVESQKYMIFAIDQEKIQDEDDICYMIKRLSIYLAKLISSEVKDFTLFYNKYVYDEYENEDND